MGMITLKSFTAERSSHRLGSGIGRRLAGTLSLEMTVRSPFPSTGTRARLCRKWKLLFHFQRAAFAGNNHVRITYSCAIKPPAEIGPGYDDRRK
jgi:hypothetical protein